MAYLRKLPKSPFWIAGFTDRNGRRRGELVAQRCASGQWTHGEPPRKVTRKDGRAITGRYVQDVVKGYRAKYG